MPHIHQTPGHVDHTVEVFIVYKDKVLLRKHEKIWYLAERWGHIELDEEPNQSALREVKEEVGLDITLLAPKGFKAFKEDDYQELIPSVFVNRHRINTDHEHVTYTYFATSTHDVVKPESEDDIWQWLVKAKLKRASICARM